LQGKTKTIVRQKIADFDKDVSKIKEKYRKTSKYFGMFRNGNSLSSEVDAAGSMV